MDTSILKKFAQTARLDLIEQVSSKLSFVLKADSSARRESPSVVADLEKAITEQGEENLIDQVAYTWFNRFCALRFMDVNGYNRVGVVSPLEGQVQPEILAEAKSGVIDDKQFNQQTIDKVQGLLSGAIPSPDGQSEAYRQLIVGTCNALYKRMPYMFERIQDFTELLMPDDLLSENSVITKMRAAMTKDACQDVEVIGWLYQFYISEKKDAVFAALKKNKKITAENIPAATQLFTPHWIVRYLVENSLGRLWMLNRPQSRLTEQMDYYIAPEAPETDFLKVTSPEELKIADPAVGSGHMLTYAFDLLYAIYEEEGYDPNEIPSLILEKNLYGIEIDDRAGALAAFALEMKAAEKLTLRRFLKLTARPNICVLEDVSFTDDEMDDVISIVGQDLYTEDLRETLTQFEQAKNFGSLIVPKLKDPAETARLVESKDLAGDMFLSEVHQRIVKVLRMAEYLSPKYNVVVANPPYMGAKGMNGPLAKWLKDKYPIVKSDLFSAFIVRNTQLSCPSGQLGFMTPFVWMFLSSYEKLRKYILGEKTITSLIQLEYSGFDGATVPICAYTLENNHIPTLKGGYIKLSDFKGARNQAPRALEAIQNPNSSWFYRSATIDFEKIPGNPIAYFASSNVISCFQNQDRLYDYARPRQGLATTNDAKFLRLWFEVAIDKFTTPTNVNEKTRTMGKWFAFNKGGEYRKWYGNNDFIINYELEGKTICDYIDNTPGVNVKSNGRVINREHYFNEGVTWSSISSGKFSMRFSPKGFVFGHKGPMCFGQNYESNLQVLALGCSPIFNYFLSVLSPTLDYSQGPLSKLPVVESNPKEIKEKVEICIALAKADWDASETSWDFSKCPILQEQFPDGLLSVSYQATRANWQKLESEIYATEKENNRILIEAYDLENELTPEVPIEEITLTCNPAYRYGTKISKEEREVRLKADTMREFLSYAVGCMFGRYSLDEPGLILANQGETLEDYLKRVPEPSFMPDDDNVIPLIDFDGDWFEDDITERFKQFLKVTFGEEHYQENIAFIEDALGKSIKKFFVKDFYADHIKRYKKRPIYWLFSSPKGTFNALIYMHRYTPSTVSVVLNEYLREFRTKLEARRDNCEQITISASASQKDKTQALKLKDKLTKAIEEMNDYEREILYPLAGQNISIDLDDGVKHNYPLFGKALKKVTGLS